MSKILHILFWGSILVASCNVAHNSGYPHKVHIGSDGGSIVVSGDGSLGGDVSVYEFDDATEHSTPSRNDTVYQDSFCIRHKWMTVRWAYAAHSFVVEAEPNTTGKSRKMWIRLGLWPDDDADVTVIQRANL